MLKYLKNALLLIAFVALGIGAGKYAGPTINDWMKPSALVAGDYSAYVKSSGKPVVLFSTSTCPWCKKTRELLAAQGVAYQDYVIDKSPEAMKTYTALKLKGVPVLVTSNYRLTGFNQKEISALLQKDGVPMQPKAL